CVSPNRDGIDRYADTTAQEQRSDDEEELVRLVLGQIVEVEDLDDVGATTPDEVDVQGQALEAVEGLLGIVGVDGEVPLDGRGIGADGDDFHVVQELQRIGSDAG